MSQRFFELDDDMYIPHRWHLAVPRNAEGDKVDDSLFMLGEPVHMPNRLRIPLESPGTPLDYTEAGIGTPVVHVRVASLFSKVAPDDVQLLPVDVEDHPDQYFILVATRLIDCIDEEASHFVRWTSGTGAPRKDSRYAIMYELRIDKSKVSNAQMFRCEGRRTALIISEDIKSALEAMGATGPKFTEV